MGDFGKVISDLNKATFIHKACFLSLILVVSLLSNTRDVFLLLNGLTLNLSGIFVGISKAVLRTPSI
jgi:hypothetical protein